MVCPKCKTVTTRRRDGRAVKEYCRNRACARYGKAIATVLVIHEPTEQENGEQDTEQEAKTTDS